MKYILWTLYAVIWFFIYKYGSDNWHWVERNYRGQHDGQPYHQICDYPMNSAAAITATAVIILLAVAVDFARFPKKYTE